MSALYQRNIRLGYILVGLHGAFFWYAPWLLFILRYISLPEAATLQAVGMVTSAIAEIPSGVLSDLIGKKKTLNLAFLLTAVGELTMAFSTTFPMFVIVWIVLNLGYSLSSGTMEAFMYDSLISDNNEDKYPYVVSRMEMIKNGVLTFASIVGGIMFSFWVGLPFLATGITKLIGLFVSLFIVEPPVDSERFSVKAFVQYTGKGIRHLFQPHLIRYTILLLLFGMFMVTAYEFLDDIAVIDWGYNEVGIGYLYAAATLLAVPAGLLYERVSKFLSPAKLILIAILFLVLNYIFSPWINVYIWTVLFLIRVLYSPIKNSAISDLLNRNTPSKIRTTTLSTYELLRKIPYVVLAGAIGMTMENYGVKVFSYYFALILLVATIVYLALFVIQRKVITRS